MFNELAQPIPFSFTARQVVRMPFKGAHEDDMVRVCETDGFSTHTYSECFPAPAWDGVEKEGNVRDLALAHALASIDREWFPTSPLCTTIAYSDNHGTWCVECGNGVYTGEHGGYVCGNPSCCNYDADNVPTWVKEMHNVA